MSLRKVAIIVAVLLIATLLAGPIYRWVGRAGNVHFSDSPPATELAPTPEEEVVIDVPPLPEHPDEGEPRRRALLQQADATCLAARQRDSAAPCRFRTGMGLLY